MHIVIINNINRISMQFNPIVSYSSATNSPKPSFYSNKLNKSVLYHKIKTECSSIENRNFRQQKSSKKKVLHKDWRHSECELNKEAVIFNEIISQFRNVIVSLDEQTTRNKLLSELIIILKKQPIKVLNESSELDEKISNLHIQINTLKKSYNDMNSKILHLKNEILQERKKRVQFSDMVSGQQKKLKKFEQTFKLLVGQTQYHQIQLRNLKQYQTRQTIQQTMNSKKLQGKENSILQNIRMSLHSSHNAINFYTKKRDMTLVKSRKCYIPSMKFFRIGDLEKMENQIKQYKYTMEKLQTVSGIQASNLQSYQDNIATQNEKLLIEVNQIINKISTFQQQNIKLQKQVNYEIQKNDQYQTKQQKVLFDLFDFMQEHTNRKKWFVNSNKTAIEKNMEIFKKFIKNCYGIQIEENLVKKQKIKDNSGLKENRTSIMKQHYEDAFKQLQQYSLKYKEKCKSSHNFKKRI